MTKNNFGFPLRRLRRNRLKKFSRDLNSENFLNVKNLILPLFVSSDDLSGTEVSSMPDIKLPKILIPQSKNNLQLKTLKICP